MPGPKFPLPATKTVVHIIEGQVTRAEVPNDWMLCSVFGEYRPPEEFRNEGQTEQSRTNCTRAYTMPYGELMLTAALTKKMQPAVNKMTAALYHEKQDNGAGISVTDYIAMLQVFAATNPDARIVDMWDGEVCYPHLEKVDGYKNLYC